MEFYASGGEAASVVYIPDVDQVKLGGIMRLDIHSTTFVVNSEWFKWEKYMVVQLLHDTTDTNKKSTQIDWPNQNQGIGLHW